MLSNLSLQTREEHPPKFPATIIESNLLVNLLDLLHVIGTQFEVSLQIAPDSGGRLRLWQHGMALCDSPSYQIANQSAHGTTSFNA